MGSLALACMVCIRVKGADKPILMANSHLSIHDADKVLSTFVSSDGGELDGVAEAVLG